MQQNAFLAATIGTGAKGGNATGVSGSLCKATPAARAVPLSLTVVPPSSAAGDAAVAAGLEAAEHRAGAAAGASNPAPNAGAKNSSKMQWYLAQGGEADGRRFVGLALTTERGLTKTGERSAQDAWDMWCAFLEQSSIVKEWEGKGQFGQVLKGEVLMKHWMPCVSVWLGFHHFVRASVSSYDRYKAILNQVCMRGKQQLFDGGTRGCDGPRHAGSPGCVWACGPPYAPHNGKAVQEGCEEGCFHHYGRSSQWASFC